jgi:hypothetical protein
VRILNILSIHLPNKETGKIGHVPLKFTIHKKHTFEMYSCSCLHWCMKKDFLTVAVSAIFEFSRNEFELGEKKFEKEKKYLLTVIKIST